MPWENPTTFAQMLDRESQRIQREWASTHGGAPLGGPRGLPGFNLPRMPNPGVPVAPPQLQVQSGP